MNESTHRSLLKAISWRITGTVDTFLLSFIITGEFKLAGTIAVSELFTKILLYYIHERVWNKVKIGKDA